MNKDFMDLAFYYADLAFKAGEVPIGCIIVKDDEVISYGFNSKEQSNSVFNHAEIIAIKSASEKLNNWRLDGCDLYVTLDPCPMCASAIKQSRIKNVYSALNNSDSDNLEIINKIFEKNDNINAQVNFISNLDAIRSKNLLNTFFKLQRNK